MAGGSRVLFGGQGEMPTNAQIGRAGELLVQCQLLKFGIESAQMTTDSGIDLVAYAPNPPRALTIQAKTKFRPVPAGGRGRLLLNWWLRKNSPADLVALVELERDRVWLLRHDEMIQFAQQDNANGKLQLYFYTDLTVQPHHPQSLSTYFDRFLLFERLPDLFGVDVAGALRSAEGVD
jgi:hypothetical protein